MGASGISSGFPLLSRSSGQVAHVLLTRSPLGLHWCCHQMDLVRLACVKHAASVRPEPGSNSPSRSTNRPEAIRKSKSRLRSGDRSQLASDGCCPSNAVHRHRHARHPTAAPCTPALAFGFLCSVFKEHRIGTHIWRTRWRCDPTSTGSAQPVRPLPFPSPPLYSVPKGRLHNISRGAHAVKQPGDASGTRQAGVGKQGRSYRFRRPSRQSPVCAALLRRAWAWRHRW